VSAGILPDKPIHDSRSARMSSISFQRRLDLKAFFQWAILIYMGLPEIDSLSITLLTDNYTDRLLPYQYPAIRPPMVKDKKFLPLPPPVAEHGFSALIKAKCNDDGEELNRCRDGKENVILFDCGTSENGVVHNAGILGIDLKSINAIVLSHGHFDHFMGIYKVLQRINTHTSVICHPDAFSKRWILLPGGKDKAKLPFLDKEELQRQKGLVTIRDGPSIITEGKIEDYDGSMEGDSNDLMPCLLITGQIPRNTPYEKGFPSQYKQDINSGKLIHDPLVNDDQAIVANIREKGLVIVSGCAHAGIVNTINYAKSLAGIDKVFAVVGGFHLTGAEIYDDAIEPTIKELKKADPKYLVPCHCTGWKATNRIIQELPEKYLQPSVCTTFTFEGST
jgi:7,8-dihydropterin-6-yl-methyl-4-(beta-D-ribofuranosyl)aminobenzene 5'-phosphate synthase